ncbi:MULTISPECIES: acyl-CoA dehydrogenase family protein [unclassified Mycobacterium]|uniref:acyl-CoA dehydrogenase family protein n=1 Tax=unclassified Mycobacterium TaxID=2642494 RepID=UPI000740292B|nr:MULTISPECIES: acyl-CoA dehydrogenase family protein [unclassified Mycobacterium]KUH83121.1 hypothetical protein AU185_04895 [Mycobacterium sp. GA-0227b]KUH84469.1 hypothetical protein AU186_21665 [Mycobacterium sp. GA-1999]KUH89395.1 hypothetical protein AU187_09760 [Mycobacterium sp. IS-1556]
MDNSEWSLLDEGLGRLLDVSAPEDVGTRLDEFGWFALYEEDRGAAVRLLFRRHGIQQRSMPILALVMALALGESLWRRLDGSRETAVVLPALGEATPPGTRRAESPTSIDVDGMIQHSNAQQFLVAVQINGCYQVGEWIPHADPLIFADGLDPDLGLHKVVGGGEFHPLAAEDAAESGRWEEAVALARVGLASELTAIGERVLDRAVEYARTRQQFGSAVGSFQSIAHQLAEAKVELEAARAAVDEAVADQSVRTAALAKLLAGRAAIRSTARAQQVFGGIGFTWEHGLHFDVRRVVVLDSLLGTTAHLEREVGFAIRNAPSVFDLGGAVGAEAR